MNTIPRAEHPNPQWKRAHWQNLNGSWEFEVDHGASGLERGFQKRAQLEGSITVPFCPESILSGIGDRDFMPAVWYRRDVVLEEAPAGRLLLHIGASDYETHVFWNGEAVTTHKGGYASFTADVTAYAMAGVNSLCICALDDNRLLRYGCGKQSRLYASHGCDYTRTTGIWQTVWLEWVAETYIESARLTPNVPNTSVGIRVKTHGNATLQAEAFFAGRSVGKAEVAVCGGIGELTLPLSETHLWDVGQGELYDVVLTYGDDRVETYFGLRHIAMENGFFYLNGKRVFQRLILDQGFYPTGIYTAPSEEELVADIERSMACGFNGARLHQKVFEPLFLYHADRLGYLVWGEWGNWGMDHTDVSTLPDMMQEWMEIMERDYSHPAVVGWCPFNETWDINGRQQDDRILSSVYYLTKAIDPTRPCIDTSGNYHTVTDIFDIHDYDQDPAVFRKTFVEPKTAAEANEVYCVRRPKMRRNGEVRGALFMSEYGGIGWDMDKVGGWGYGNGPKTEEEFYQRYEGLTAALLDSPYVMGLCYTQLTDVEQETNGLYTYERKAKFDVARLAKIMTRKAAIEE